MNLKQQVKKTIETYEMIHPGDLILAGVSGGADSVCLLLCLQELGSEMGFQTAAIHIEHGIRGEESNSDAEFVRQLCREKGIRFAVEHVNAVDEAKKRGMSLEEAARALRYRVLRHYLQEWKADRIATAHTEHDQAETVLMNLCRGSGLKGLGGIRPAVGDVIRPLLFCRRDEIEQWLQERRVSWRTDSTNLSEEYTRNRVRRVLLPMMQEMINERSSEHIAEAAEHLQRAEQFIQQQAAEWYERCIGRSAEGMSVNVGQFRQADSLLQEYMMRYCLEQLCPQNGLKDMTAEHIRKMCELAGMKSGKQISLPGGITALRRTQDILVGTQRAAAEKRNIKSEPQLLEQDGIYENNGLHFQVEYLKTEKKKMIIPEKKYTKWLAYDTINGNVCLRNRQEGDYLIVNREGGRKKLKDYFIDQKIPREERDTIPLIAQGAHVLWAVGCRISEQAKVTEDTERLIRVQVVEEGNE